MSRISDRLLAWYDVNARRFPWRKPPGTAPQEPYKAWLAEVMLQQTTTTAVIPYYEKFLRRWPTITDLAAEEDAEVMEAWAGLGYYARARNMLAAARAISAEGKFPETSEELRALKGFGPYTSAAVAAISFGERVAVVDANVKRVFHRLRGDETVAKDSDMSSSVLLATPEDRPGDFAQALMDLGATVCRPKSPQCHACPLEVMCVAAASGEPERFPAPVKKKAKPVREGTIWIARHDDQVLVVRRPDSGLLGGTLAFPSCGWDGTPCDQLPFAADWKCVGEITHTFTHFHANITVMTCDLKREGGTYRRLSDTAEELPTLMKKAWELHKKILLTERTM